MQRRDDGEELALLGKTECVRKSQVCDRCRPAAAGDSDSEGGDEGLSSAVALSMWMIMLSAVTSARSLMLIVLFFLTYAHTHMHFKKAPPSNRSFPRGPCGRCKGEDEVEAEAGKKEQRRRDVRGSSTSNTEIPALSMAASQRRGSRPEREREAAAGLLRNLSVGSEERMARLALAPARAVPRADCAPGRFRAWQRVKGR